MHVKSYRGTGVAVTRYFADYAWLGGDRVSERVLLEVDGERISAVRAGADRPADADHLAGVTVPAHAPRGRDVLDLARGHVRRRRAADP